MVRETMALSAEEERTRVIVERVLGVRVRAVTLDRLIDY